MKASLPIKTILSAALAGLLFACNSGPEVPVTQNTKDCHQVNDGKVMSSMMARPALPDSSITALSDKLEYILETDHEDRMDGTIFADISRDSLRLTQVITWYNTGLICDWQDKYHAAFIFLHQGGPLMAENDQYLKIAYELFADVVRETTNPEIREEAKALSANALESYLHWLLWEEVTMSKSHPKPPSSNTGA